MDPFSIATGVVGTLAVVGHVSKKLKYLKTHIQDSEGTITSLIDEISLLEASLRVFQSEAEKVKTSSLPTATHETLAALYQHLDTFIPKVDKLLQDLGDKIDTCLKPGTTSDGAPKSKVDKWKWLKEKDNIKKLREEIANSTKAVNNLIGPLKLCLLNQLQAHVDQMSSKVSHLDTIQSHVDGITSEMRIMRHESRAISSTVTATFTRIEEVEQFVAQINTQTSQLTALCTKMVEERKDPNGPPPDSIWNALPDDGYGRQTDSHSLGGISGTGTWRIDTGCDIMCSCRCHKGDKGIFTLQGLLIGSVSAAVSGYPLFNPKCDQKACRGPKSLEFTVTYRFPRWFWKKACYVRLVNNRNLHSGIQPIFRMKNQLPQNSETLAACQTGNVERLRQLFEARLATPHDEDPSGRSLLAIAAFHRQYETCKVLKDIYNADPHEIDRSGNSAFSYAWEKVFQNPNSAWHSQVLSLFPSTRDLPHYDPTLSIIHRCILGFTSLDVSEQLHFSFDKINDGDGSGQTPLFLACELSDLEATQTLMELGANADIVNSSGDAPLHRAVLTGKPDVVSTLLKNGADANVRDRGKRTPLHWCFITSGRARFQNIHALLEHKADPTLKDDPVLGNGVSPMYQSITNPYDETGCVSAKYSQILLDHGAKFDDVDRYGDSVFETVTGRSMHTSFTFMCQNHVYRDVKSRNGGTVLHWVVDRCYYIQKEFLDIMANFGMTGVDVDAVDNSGKTAMELAREKWGHSDEIFGKLKKIIESVKPMVLEVEEISDDDSDAEEFHDAPEF